MNHATPLITKRDPYAIAKTVHSLYNRIKDENPDFDETGLRQLIKLGELFYRSLDELQHSPRTLGAFRHRLDTREAEISLQDFFNIFSGAFGIPDIEFSNDAHFNTTVHEYLRGLVSDPSALENQAKFMKFNEVNSHLFSSNSPRNGLNGSKTGSEEPAVDFGGAWRSMQRTGGEEAPSGRSGPASYMKASVDNDIVDLESFEGDAKFRRTLYLQAPLTILPAKNAKFGGLEGEGEFEGPTITPDYLNKGNEGAEGTMEIEKIQKRRKTPKKQKSLKSSKNWQNRVNKSVLPESETLSGNTVFENPRVEHSNLQYSKSTDIKQTTPIKQSRTNAHLTKLTSGQKPTEDIIRTPQMTPDKQTIRLISQTNQLLNTSKPMLPRELVKEINRLGGSQRPYEAPSALETPANLGTTFSSVCPSNPKTSDQIYSIDTIRVARSFQTHQCGSGQAERLMLSSLDETNRILVTAGNRLKHSAKFTSTYDVEQLEAAAAGRRRSTWATAGVEADRGKIGLMRKIEDLVKSQLNSSPEDDNANPLVLSAARSGRARGLSRRKKAKRKKSKESKKVGFEQENEFQEEDRKVLRPILHSKKGGLNLTKFTRNQSYLEFLESRREYLISQRKKAALAGQSPALSAYGALSNVTDFTMNTESRSRGEEASETATEFMCVRIGTDGFDSAEVSLNSTAIHQNGLKLSPESQKMEKMQKSEILKNHQKVVYNGSIEEQEENTSCSENNITVVGSREALSNSQNHENSSNSLNENNKENESFYYNQVPKNTKLFSSPPQSGVLAQSPPRKPFFSFKDMESSIEAVGDELELSAIEFGQREPVVVRHLLSTEIPEAKAIHILGEGSGGVLEPGETVYESYVVSQERLNKVVKFGLEEGVGGGCEDSERDSTCFSVGRPKNYFKFINRIQR